MSNKALLIGINYVGTENELKGCINDVINMKKYLLSEGYKESEIRMLTEASAVHPTYDNIVAGLDWLQNEATADSNLFLHYSGHGGSVFDSSNDEDDHRDETICPVDMDTKGMMKDDVLRKNFVDKLPVGCHLTAIFDCCHSGTILDLRYNWTGNPKYAGAYVIKTNTEKETKAHVMVLSGCLDPQTSADTIENGKAQGALTYGYLATVAKSRDKGREVITCDTMLKCLDKFLRSKGYVQKPQLSTGLHDDLTKPFIVLAKKTSETPKMFHNREALSDMSE
jgi:hypothetical protein